MIRSALRPSFRPLARTPAQARDSSLPIGPCIQRPAIHSLGRLVRPAAARKCSASVARFMLHSCFAPMAASDLAPVAVVDPDALPGVPAASTAEPGHMDPAIFAFRVRPSRSLGPLRARRPPLNPRRHRSLAAQIRGLAAATYTPFAADGSVDLSVVPRDAAFLSRNGVSYAFVNGTSGESMSLSTAERKALVEAWVETGRRVDPPVRVIAHIGCNALPEAKEMATHAAAAGAVAIAAMAPTFFKAAKSADLALWLQEVCAAAPTLPFYYYHFPVITGGAWAVRGSQSHVRARRIVGWIFRSP